MVGYFLHRRLIADIMGSEKIPVKFLNSLHN